ncbi:DUF6933 domain-containing protein [Dyadobacter psychrotolerans]|jgi:hypothetical protein|uniref:DUF6933 domain-containing protein n=1 Tax=Dyadobacter psychrotolerans TaxID=2541721 RepID=A0A4R5DDL7_9BACT|nr:hypothetical protein [Dyadobacter psychrotolerans]TDE09774.1 hypothetical protein E0F88_29735 [Dyadobacter psychrotolerans]
MVQIHCTQKLGKFIKANKGKGLPRAGQDWSAHLFFVSGRKCIVFVHKKTLYTVMLLDIFKKDMTYINRLFLEALIDQLKSDNILGNHEGLIRDLYKEISLVSTDNDRKTLGVINNIVSIYQGNFEDLESVRRYASEGVNKMPWQSTKYVYSKDIMLKELNLI